MDHTQFVQPGAKHAKKDGNFKHTDGQDRKIPAVLSVISVTFGPSEQRSCELIVNELPGLHTLSAHHNKQQLQVTGQQTVHHAVATICEPVAPILRVNGSIVTAT